MPTRSPIRPRQRPLRRSRKSGFPRRFRRFVDVASTCAARDRGLTLQPPRPKPKRPRKPPQPPRRPLHRSPSNEPEAGSLVAPLRTKVSKRASRKTRDAGTVAIAGITPRATNTRRPMSDRDRSTVAATTARVARARMHAVRARRLPLLRPSRRRSRSLPLLPLR